MGPSIGWMNALGSAMGYAAPPDLGPPQFGPSMPTSLDAIPAVSGPLRVLDAGAIDRLPLSPMMSPAGPPPPLQSSAITPAPPAQPPGPSLRDVGQRAINAIPGLGAMVGIPATPQAPSVPTAAVPDGGGGYTTGGAHAEAFGYEDGAKPAPKAATFGPLSPPTEARNLAGTVVMTPGAPAHEVKVSGDTQRKGEATFLDDARTLAKNTLDTVQAEQLRAQQQAQQEAAARQVYAATLAQEQARHDAEAKAMADDYVNHVANVAAMGQIDPDRFWASRSTPSKIAAIAGVFLSAIGAGATGQPNLAIKAIEKQQENDLAAQRFSYQSGLDALKGLTTAYGMTMERYGDQHVADNASRAAINDVTIAKLRDLAAGAKTAEERAAYNTALIHFADAQRQFTTQGTALVQATGGGPKVAIPDGAGGVVWVPANGPAHLTWAAERRKAGDELNLGDAKGLVDLAKAEIEHGGKAEADAKKLWVPTGPGPSQGYAARNDTEAAQHRSALAETRKTLDIVRRIRALNPSVGDKVFPTDDSRALNELTTELMGSLKEQQKLGALDAGSQSYLDKMIGDPRSVMGNEENLKQLERSARNNAARLQESVTGHAPATAPPGAVKEKW